jgi:hypothetical protein
MDCFLNPISYITTHIYQAKHRMNCRQAAKILQRQIGVKQYLNIPLIVYETFISRTEKR